MTFLNETTFDNVISLGQTCLTRFQINRFLINSLLQPCSDTWEALEISNSKRLFGGSFPLDWCITRNYVHLASQFRNRFDTFFDKADFIIDVHHGAFNARSSVSFDHLFSRVSVEGKAVVTPDIFASEFQSNYSKICHLTQKLISLRGSTLFLISSAEPIPKTDLMQLYLGITSCYKHGMDFAIADLYMNGTSAGSPFLFIGGQPRIYYIPIEANLGNDRANIGVHSSWDKPLSLFRYNKSIAFSRNPLIESEPSIFEINKS